jgi:hypothetical protein
LQRYGGIKLCNYRSFNENQRTAVAVPVEVMDKMGPVRPLSHAIHIGFEHTIDEIEALFSNGPLFRGIGE